MTNDRTRTALAKAIARSRRTARRAKIAARLFPASF